MGPPIDFEFILKGKLMEFGIDAQIAPLLALLGSKIYVDFRMGDFERKRLAGPLPVTRGAGAGGPRAPLLPPSRDPGLARPGPSR